MRLKKESKKADEFIGVRCTKEVKNKIKQKASLYSEGNISEWILYAAANFVPSGEELEDEKPKRRRK